MKYVTIQAVSTPKSTTGQKPAQIVKREIKRLQKILNKGLPSSYSPDSPDDYFVDWGPDFSWEPKSCIVEFKALLKDKTWVELAKQVKRNIPSMILLLL